MAARTKKRLFFWILLPLIIGGGGYFYYSYSQSNSETENSDPTVTVEMGTIVEKALAIGTIEPETEIEVKSIFPGVVETIFAEEGQFVRKGDPLIEVRPDPTPLELAEAKRNLERILIEKENLQKDLGRIQEMKNRELISDREYEQALEEVDDVTVREQISRERLELLESGRITIGDTTIESIIRAPIDGYILERMVDIGDPIVPLTSYQAGTPLMNLAQMENLLFKGTVDEIDVGKVEIGLPVEIKIGALPGVIVHGEVSKISLKAREDDNATVFPIEIMITDASDATLRAGYSANADIIINRRMDVPTIPERLVDFNDGIATVEIPGSEPGQREKIKVELGLSDAINIEVISGLDVGDNVLEPVPQSLTVR
ncbi:MAG: efflux RND transporter periplasmic adaptor subunit [Balneolaceae bacterium]